MRPEIAALDAALAKVGETIVLRRVVGDLPNTVNIDVTCRACVRSYQPDQIVGNIKQTDSKVILSPSDIARAQWPGGVPEGDPISASLPRMYDRVVVAGRARSINVVDPIYVDGELVRLELNVTG